MAVNITFQNPLNESVQVGDWLLYSLPVSNQSGMNHPSNAAMTTTEPICLGLITAITPTIFHRQASTTNGNTSVTLNTTAAVTTDYGVHARGVTKGTRVAGIAGTTLTLNANATRTRTNVAMMIGKWVITVNVPVGTPPTPGTNYHYFFLKAKDVEQSQLIGYYAEVKLINDSKSRGEIHQLTSEFYQSSK